MRGRLLATGVMGAALIAAAYAGSQQHSSSGTGHGPVTASAAPSCAIATGPLPTWARGGFTPPTTPMPYVLGANHDIVAILFGNPLRSPPEPDRNNKILWVSRVSQQGDPLEIRAQLSGSNRVVAREVQGGPGPSIIDMPTAGCWIFNVSWSGHTDRLAIRYTA